MTAIFTTTKVDLKANTGIQAGHCGGHFLPRMKSGVNCAFQCNNPHLRLQPLHNNERNSSEVLLIIYSHRKYFLNMYNFRAVFRFATKLRGRYRDPHAHLAPTYAHMQSLPIINIFCYFVPRTNLHGTSHSPNVPSLPKGSLLVLYILWGLTNVQTKHFHSPKNPLCTTYSSLPSTLSLATADLFLVSIVLPFSEHQIIGLIQSVHSLPTLGSFT